MFNIFLREYSIPEGNHLHASRANPSKLGLQPRLPPTQHRHQSPSLHLKHVIENGPL